MSLINQVLKDLEKRHADGTQFPGLLRSLRPLPQLRAGRNLWPLLVLGTALISGALIWWWLDQRSTQATSLPPAARIVLAPAAVVGAPQALAPLPPSPESQGPTLFAPETMTAGAVPPAAASVAPTTVSPPAAAVRPVQSDTAELASDRALPRPLAPSVNESATETLIEEDLSPASIEKQESPITAADQKQLQFRRGVEALERGQLEQAERSFVAVLKLDSGADDARQALLGLYLDSGRREEAERLLLQGLAVNPGQVRFAMFLARLQLDRGQPADALATLEQTQGQGASMPEFLAMMAAAQLRVGRHDEAARNYALALQSVPDNALWHMGLGLALRAAGKQRDARTAFQHARELGTLSPDLQAFVDRQLRELQALR